MRRIAAAVTAIVCTATLVGCASSGSDEGSSADPTSSAAEAPPTTPAPEATAADDATDPAPADPATADPATADPAAAGTSIPTTVTQLAAMSQKAIEDAGMSEVKVGDLTYTLGYSARGSALVITCTLPKGVDISDSKSEFITTVNPMMKPSIDALLPTVREIDPQATVVVEYLQADGTVIYTQSSE